MRRNVSAVIAAMLVLLIVVGRGIWLTIDRLGTGTQPTATSSSDSSVMPPAPSGLEKFYGQDPSWASCNDGFQCGKIEVPLDYAQPMGATISLAVMRLRADKPLGSLVMNPGGPGASGIEYVGAASQVTTQRLRDNYDLVGFDPRGVGASSPVECLTDIETDQYIAADGSPDDAAEVAQTIDIMRYFGQSCQSKSAQLFMHIDTVSAARDMDILRDALGDPALNWFGKSYGTLLGATYADLFPQNVGRMMLDGALDPALPMRDLSYGQAVGFETALDRFIADCPTHKDCPLPSEASSAKRAIVSMLDRLDTVAPQLSDGRAFTQAMGVTGVVGGLYDKVYGWTALRSSLGAALKGDFEEMAQTVDLYTSRQDDGTYGDNSNDAIVAINCLDHPTRYETSAIQQDAQAWSKVAPVFGAYLAWGQAACQNWPTGSTATEHAIAAPGSRPILVVGTRYDPATPYAWAVSLANQLQNASLLTFEGDGHTAYYQGSQCVDNAVDSYFVAGSLPQGLVCADGP